MRCTQGEPTPQAPLLRLLEDCSRELKVAIRIKICDGRRLHKEAGHNSQHSRPYGGESQLSRPDSVISSSVAAQPR